MVSQMPFPLSTMKTLSAEAIEKLATLGCTTVQSFRNRTQYDADRDALGLYLGMNVGEMKAAAAEALSISPIWDSNPPHPPQFAMGALIPPEMAWQEGRTAGEIALIQCLLRCDEELRQVPVLEDKGLRTEIDDVLRMYNVDKYKCR